MEPLKHECGVAMIRLLRPLQYYREKYGTYTYALDKLYLLMEKQHNRGQEAAGVGIINTRVAPGGEYAFRERALGTGAITEIFQALGAKIPAGINSMSPREVQRDVPMLGDIYMGHLRYSTTGRSGMEFTHPFLRRNNWRSRALMICGNFNMTNVDEIFRQIVSTGQHPRLYSDTVLLLEQIGHALDKENHRLYRQYRDEITDPALARRIEAEVDMAQVLRQAVPAWDGGFVICGTTGSGNSFVVRDSNGIRPAFYYHDDEIMVLTSERPVLQTVFGLEESQVKELLPGEAILVDPQGQISLEQILEPGVNRRCSFERVYFSRGSDADIYRERKALGANIIPSLLEMVDRNIDNLVVSYIPNTAEAAFYGMCEELNRTLNALKLEQIMALTPEERNDPVKIGQILKHRVRSEKVAHKDIKLRTFIAEGTSRNDLAAHVYDITYGTVVPGKDTLAIIDDSIVRGTTLRQSILKILDRLEPKRIIIISSSPQVRYPDYYGIDMPHLDELIAFRAAVELLIRTGRRYILDSVYNEALAQETLPEEQRTNCVKEIYAPFSDAEISEQIVHMLTPDSIKARVDILYQSLEGLHRAITDHPGDWYFSGDYPTAGGTRLVNSAYIDFYRRKILCQ